MSPEKQRIAIAEACGWRIDLVDNFKILRYGDQVSGMCSGKHLSDQDVWQIGIAGDEYGRNRIPNYLNDLNAMHEAENVLNANQANLYRKILSGLTANAYIGSHHPQLCFPEHATAAQRCEAFLRTIGKWEDDA